MKTLAASPVQPEVRRNMVPLLVKMDETTLHKLRLLAPQLNQLQLNPNAKCFYEILSGGLLWDDEFPDPSLVPNGSLEGLRRVLWYRTALILGEDNQRDKELWPAMEKLFPNWSGEASAKQSETLWWEAQKLFPNWPGFDPLRRSPSLREKCFEMELLARSNIDKLFD